MPICRACYHHKVTAIDQRMNATIRLQREDFDAAEEAALTRGRTDIGAVVTFAGICRDHEAGHGVAAMTLEHYPGMAEEEIARHVAEAQRAGRCSASPSFTAMAASCPATISCLSSPPRRTGRRRSRPPNS